MAFQKVADAEFLRGEHEVLRFWSERGIFDRLREQNAAGEPWSFLDGPITANNPMGVHHAWGRTYKDAYQRFRAMQGHALRYQNGFDCQGLWVEVEVQKELGLNTKEDIERFGMDRFVTECKRRVLQFAARQTEQSIRLGYWMDWDDPHELCKLAEAMGGPGDGERRVRYRTAGGKEVEDAPHRIVEKLGNRDWGGSYFTFSTENNETIWSFLKKCHARGKIARGHDVMPWSGLAGSAYSQMEVADGRRLTTHRSVFVRFPIIDKGRNESLAISPTATASDAPRDKAGENANEYLLVWTTTPWTLTSNVAAAVNPELDYVRLQTNRDGAIYYFARDNLEFKRLDREFKEGFGRPEWGWPEDVPRLKTLSQIFKEQGGYEILGTLKGAEMIGWQYVGPFDDLPAQQQPGGLVADGRGTRDERRAAGDETATALSRTAAPEPGNEKDEFASPQIPLTFAATPYADAPNAELTADPTAPSSLVSRRSSIECHRVIDGGRDSKGNANVTAGEGTGIVHIAPGCGDVDHKLGEEHGLVSIAPLGEDGTFVDGLGEFTGMKATSPAVPELVLQRLREQGFHVADEVYPHIYPFCWRTGDELVFRLVDEWFIDMDWREEIKEVVRAIDWLPESVQGKERELEWLAIMRDWMISKKRYWGLALPIWVDDQTGDFEVMGSLAELKERAVEGWDDFEGNTPHRPWIDKVKIRNPQTGNLMSRVPDVGNPWLDAGIVGFSTLGYNRDRDYWQQWYPADLVLECFPGQFRNWFYSLLAMSTMMRHGETDDPRQKRPFKTLFGHRLVMDESGQPMHKSDGTAIWFEEAAEQLGVDTLRWMYLAQNPAADLRFGTRHPDQPVTLQTPDGPLSTTKEGFPTCLVTSRPADEVRRQVLIPLWNSYAFFVNYARLDGFDPAAPAVPYAERPEIDRWVLSNLQSLIETSGTAWANYDPATACAAAARFIDDLSNWYIRRNRRRFWRSARAERRETRGEGTASSASVPLSLGREVRGEGSDSGHPASSTASPQAEQQVTSGVPGQPLTSPPFDVDKLAAYQTLYEVLVTLTKLLAPAIPFLAERMYQNLVVGASAPAPESVHLCRYPDSNREQIDVALSVKMAAAQTIVRMGHRLREESGHRVRQPLAELQFRTDSAELSKAIESLADVIREELNVKVLTRAEHLDELVHYTYKPNLKTLGPKYGKRLAAIRNELPALGEAQLAPLRKGEKVTVTIGGEPTELAPEDVMVGTEQAADWVTASEGEIQLALSTTLTPDLIREGLARDFVRQIQQLRKDAGYEIEDRITIAYATTAEAAAAIDEFADYIKAETLADRLELVKSLNDSQTVRAGDAEVKVRIERMS